MPLIGKLWYYRELLGFFVLRKFQGMKIPDEPYFSEEVKSFFSSSLKSCRFYLEYGSGGSTVMAARLGKNFISVDTDKFFLKCVGKKIGVLSPDQHLVHADIGLTGPWGRPVPAHDPSPRRLKKWHAYAGRPWWLIDANSPPDLILIDGRFRVATLLTCCANLPAGADTKILVDDYANRPHYHVMHEYARLDGLCGRMAVFRPAPAASPKLDRLIEEYSTDWR